jgi:hypothetical protein
MRNLNPEKAEGLTPELQVALGAVVGSHRVVERAHLRVQRTDRTGGAAQLSAGRATQAGCECQVTPVRLLPEQNVVRPEGVEPAQAF